MGILVALAPLACGDDTDDGDNNTAGTSAAGKGGNTSNGGKSGSGGKATGGSANNGGDDSGEAGEGGSGGAAPKARIRVIHASPNAPSVDIYPKDGAIAAVENVAYGDATDFIEVDPGPIAFDLRAAGADAGDAAAFTTEPVELTADADYSFVAAGDFAQATDADVGFRVLALEHDFAAPVDGVALARVVHATPAWANVDMDVIGTNGVDLPGLAAFDNESNVELPADAEIPVAFQTEADGVLSKLVLPELAEGSESFVIATGNPDSPFRSPANGFALLVVDQEGNVSWVKENPRLHLVNLDVSTVDLYDSDLTAVEEKLADDVAADELVRFWLPASEGVTLKAVADDAASGAAADLASGMTSTLVAGEQYLAYIAGETIVTLHEQFDLDQPTKVLLRGAHASTALALQQTVDFGVAASGSLTNVLIPEIAPGMASGEAGVAINPGAVILGAAVTATTTPLLAQKSFTAGTALQAGERGFLLLSGVGTLWFVDTSVAGWSVR